MFAFVVSEWGVAERRRETVEQKVEYFPKRAGKPPNQTTNVDFWSPRGVVREPSGEPLGSVWALLARLLALPGLFFCVSGAFAATVGQEARKSNGLGSMLVDFRYRFNVFSNLFVVSPARFLFLRLLSRSFSSCSALLFAPRGKGRHAFDTVKLNCFHDFQKFAKAAALRKEGRT